LHAANGPWFGTIDPFAPAPKVAGSEPRAFRTLQNLVFSEPRGICAVHRGRRFGPHDLVRPASRSIVPKKIPGQAAVDDVQTGVSEVVQEMARTPPEELRPPALQEVEASGKLTRRSRGSRSLS
jgi:hypothetical protein